MQTSFVKSNQFACSLAVNITKFFYTKDRSILTTYLCQIDRFFMTGGCHELVHFVQIKSSSWLIKTTIMFVFFLNCVWLILKHLSTCIKLELLFNEFRNFILVVLPVEFYIHVFISFLTRPMKFYSFYNETHDISLIYSFYANKHLLNFLVLCRA